MNRQKLIRKSLKYVTLKASNSIVNEGKQLTLMIKMNIDAKAISNYIF